MNFPKAPIGSYTILRQSSGVVKELKWLEMGFNLLKSKRLYGIVSVRKEYDGRRRPLSAED
jgi:hypothetical protein